MWNKKSHSVISSKTVNKSLFSKFIFTYIIRKNSNRMDSSNITSMLLLSLYLWLEKINREQIYLEVAAHSAKVYQISDTVTYPYTSSSTVFKLK